MTPYSSIVSDQTYRVRTLTAFRAYHHSVSGHARQIKDLNGDEPDGFDESTFVALSVPVGAHDEIKLISHLCHGLPWQL